MTPDQKREIAFLEWAKESGATSGSLEECASALDAFEAGAAFGFQQAVKALRKGDMVDSHQELELACKWADWLEEQRDET